MPVSGSGGGSEHEHAYVRGYGNRAFGPDDPPSEYVEGYMVFYVDADDEDGFGPWGSGVGVEVATWHGVYDSEDAAFQLALNTDDNEYAWRSSPIGSAEWGEWEQQGALAPHEHDHIANLTRDSREAADPITDYPVGLSAMRVELNAAWDTVDSHNKIVQTFRFEETGNNYGWQFVLDLVDGTVYKRKWSDVDGLWDGVQNMAQETYWGDVLDKPTVFPPDIVGEPSEGDVVKWVSGAATWSAP